jgi:hypothetical protein
MPQNPTRQVHALLGGGILEDVIGGLRYKADNQSYHLPVPCIGQLLSTSNVPPP